MPYLVVLKGPFEGRRIELVGEDFRIGREKGKNHLILDEESVSRRHARVSRAPAGYLLEDLGSRAGTEMNGQPIREPRPLQGGDEFSIGSTRFRFQDENGTAPDAVREEASGPSGLPESNVPETPPTVRRPKERAPAPAALPSAAANPRGQAARDPFAGRLARLAAEEKERSRRSKFLREDLAQRSGRDRFLLYLGLAAGTALLAYLVRVLTLLVLGEP